MPNETFGEQRNSKMGPSARSKVSRGIRIMIHRLGEWFITKASLESHGIDASQNITSEPLPRTAAPPTTKYNPIRPQRTHPNSGIYFFGEYSERYPAGLP